MNDGLTLPLEVRDPEGDLVTILLMNAKAANKSREQGELWTVVPPGDRVLPIEGADFLVLETVEGSRYRCVLGDWSAVDAVREAAENRFAGLVEAELPAAAAGAGNQPTLAKLKEVVARRRAEMPEGSYTTLLFQKGEEKIRKKTGEEAIELVLARTPKDLVAESADLIYHLMVLLEVTGVPVEDVLGELEGRMK
jgi:phosphoribosyl-ATP pyrophosphohydrolase